MGTIAKKTVTSFYIPVFSKKKGFFSMMQPLLASTLQRITCTTLAFLLLVVAPLQTTFAATTNDGFIALKPLKITPSSSTSSWGNSKANSLSNLSSTTGLRPVTANASPSVKPLSTWQAPAKSTWQSASSSTPSVAGLEGSSLPTYKSGLSVLGGGEIINIRLNEPISSQTMQVGETITATVESPLIKNGQVVLPSGSELSGNVLAVRPAKRVGQHGELDIRFYTATAPNGQRTSLNAVVVTKSGDATMKGDTYGMDVAKGLGIAVGGTAAGAVAGTAVGGLLSVAGTGAAVGTAIGGAAGVGYALARRGKAVELPKGSYLQVRNLKAEEAPSYQPQY
jgi:hypothetical protein